MIDTISTMTPIHQNGHSPSYTHDLNARQYINALKAHEKPASIPDTGKWSQLCGIFARAYDANPDKIDTTINAIINSGKYPDLKKLLADSSDLPNLASFDVVPPLPESAYLPPEASQGASPCMDVYIPYSKRISPEGYEYFHEAGFLWALSTVAARRVRFPLGDDGYTPLMLIMCADSSLYKKTTTAKAAMKWLHSADLGWFLGAKRTTPQKLIYDMAGVVPKNFPDLDRDKQEWVERRLAFSGQRGWYNDEFGKFVKGTQNANSAMADFQQLLLEMDSCDPIYDNSTISRGTEIIDKPYLALLGSMTPANLRTNGKRGSEFWGDGFWARFTFVCPPHGTSMDNPFDAGDIPVPGYLIGRLKEWHNRLGIPEARVEPVIENDKDTGRLSLHRDNLPENTCVLGAGVHESWKRYRSALKSIITSWNTADLNGNYDRLPTKAIRVASLLASLENDGVIEMRHWAKAQEIAERWRQSLHELYAQVNINGKEPSLAATIEDEIMRHIYRLESDKHIHPSAADLRNYMKHHAVSRIQQECDELVKAGVLGVEKTSHTKRYSLMPTDSKKEETQEN